jgi:hypothetical protein
METVKLGGHTYTVNLGSYAPPGPPAASNAGSLSSNIAVEGEDGSELQASR